MKTQRDAIQQSTQDMRDFLERQPIPAWGCPGSPGCAGK
jgi:hypothetical protein